MGDKLGLQFSGKYSLSTFQFSVTLSYLKSFFKLFWFMTVLIFMRLFLMNQVICPSHRQHCGARLREVQQEEKQPWAAVASPRCPGMERRQPLTSRKERTWGWDPSPCKNTCSHKATFIKAKKALTAHPMSKTNIFLQLGWVEPSIQWFSVLVGKHAYCVTLRGGLWQRTLRTRHVYRFVCKTLLRGKIAVTLATLLCFLLLY